MTPEERVRAAFQERGVAIQVHHPGTVETATRAAAAVGCELGAIVKSLVFLAGGEPLLVLTPGDRQVSDAKLAAITGVARKRVRFAPPDVAFEITGYRVGGVPPLGHNRPLPTLMDLDFQRYTLVWAAAGTADTLFPIAPDLLRQVTGARLEDVCRRPAPDGRPDGG